MSAKEKSVKRSIEKLFLQLEHRQEQVNSSQAREEIRCHEHFSDTTRQIDIHREKLKEKIDDLALKMIDQTEELDFWNFVLDNQSLIISCSDDTTIKIWDTTTYECVSVLRGHL